VKIVNFRYLFCSLIVDFVNMQVSDAATGEVYYHNEETGEVSWEFPGGLAKSRSHQVYHTGCRARGVTQTQQQNTISIRVDFCV
jgi:hypothetical protein